LLDEATSALDPGAEAAINATLDKASRGRTVLSVTHRLASVVDADRIFVLDRGVVREQGTHAELLHAEGLYKHLWDKQGGFTLSEDSWRAYVTPARLRSIEILQPLSDEALESIAGLFVTEIHAAGRTLFQAGDRGDRFYILVRGAVDVLVPGASGGLQRLRRLEDGDYFGEMALLRDAVRCATIKTAEPCLLLALAREPFLELVEVHRALREAFDAAAREPPPP
jgi:ATP-binding cassette subfamily B protein